MLPPLRHSVFPVIQGTSLAANTQLSNSLEALVGAWGCEEANLMHACPLHWPSGWRVQCIHTL